MTTYTVYRATDGDNAHSGLSLDEAVDEMLSHDGRDWEIRKDGNGWRIFNTFANHQFGMRSTRFYSAQSGGWDARAELLAKVIKEEINGLLAMPDTEYEAMMAAAFDYGEG
jgi:hypothetical protein